MNQELELLELEVKSLGYRDASDYIRKNKRKLTKENLKMLELIEFEFYE